MARPNLDQNLIIFFLPPTRTDGFLLQLQGHGHGHGHTLDYMLLPGLQL